MWKWNQYLYSMIPDGKIALNINLEPFVHDPEHNAGRCCMRCYRFHLSKAQRNVNRSSEECLSHSGGDCFDEASMGAQARPLAVHWKVFVTPSEKGIELARVCLSTARCNTDALPRATACGGLLNIPNPQQSLVGKPSPRPRVTNSNDLRIQGGIANSENFLWFSAAATI